MQVTKYGFPRKVKIVNAKRGRPKKPHGLIKQHVYEAFCEWAAKPTPLKEDKTMQDFAKTWGVNPITLGRWKKKQDFWEKVASWRIAWAKDKTSDVVHGLFKRAASRGEAAEVKLWMQLVEDWSEKTPAPTSSITVIGIRGVTQKDLEKLTKPSDDIIEGEEVKTVEN